MAEKPLTIFDKNPIVDGDAISLMRTCRKITNQLLDDYLERFFYECIG